MKHVLLLHGALGTAKQLEPLAQALAPDYLVHTLTFTGHGGGTPPQAYSFQQFEDDIMGYLDTEGLQQVAVFGYSMGGYAALYAGLKHPTRFSSIATLGTKLVWTAAGSARETAMLNAAKIEAKIPAFAAQLQQLHGPDNWKQVLQATAQMMLNLGNKPLLSTPDFEQLKHPTLIAIGDRDHTAGLTDTVATYQHMPQAQLWVLPGTPHPLQQVHIGTLATGLKRFWNGSGGS